jgi:exocyst complex component 3
MSSGHAPHGFSYLPSRRAPSCTFLLDSSLSTLVPAKEFESSFEIVETVLSLLRPSKSLAFLSFWSFAKMHGPNLAFVELMKGCGVLDRSAVNEVMDSIKRKVKENLTDHT